MPGEQQPEQQEQQEEGGEQQQQQQRQQQQREDEEEDGGSRATHTQHAHTPAHADWLKRFGSALPTRNLPQARCSSHSLQSCGTCTKRLSNLGER